MYKNFTRKIWRIMRLTTVILITALVQVSAASFGQRITMNYKHASLKEVLKEIRKKSGYDILFDQRIVAAAKPVYISLSNGSIEDAMSIALKGQYLSYSIDEKIVTVVQTEKTSLERLLNYMNLITVSGRIINEEGTPLIGATITIKGTKQSVFSNANGEFLIRNVEEKNILLISYVGYKTKEVKALSELGNIRLELFSGKLDDVVVTGIVERKRGSFTGSAATITGEQLKAIGNQNVIQALRSLDPSFIVVDNNLKGSDPNALARIELRGKTSITMNTNSGTLTDQFSVDPNMPLFILDGFESTLRQVTDLDINRIASITILKDAASTALYGARSANGVVVVETIKPKAGELRVTYTGDFSVSAADLSDYNLMNSTEKLEFERLSGRYAANGVGNEDFVMLDRFYNQRLMAVKQGVNTYWLNEPLRATAFDQNHSIYASGGSSEFQYGVGMNTQSITGLMKGSDRKNWGARADLTYRKGKLNVTNRIFISGSRADESPYGSFTTYAKINPYYKKEIVGKYVEQIPAGYDGRSLANVANPLYNAQLNSEQYNKV
jgi:TonB-dependent SusC/RagA subfamily outer membrane receptor